MNEELYVITSSYGEYSDYSVETLCVVSSSEYAAHLVELLDKASQRDQELSNEVDEHMRQWGIQNPVPHFLPGKTNKQKDRMPKSDIQNALADHYARYAAHNEAYSTMKEAFLRDNYFQPEETVKLIQRLGIKPGTQARCSYSYEALPFFDGAVT